MLPSDNHPNLPLFLQWNKIYNVEDVSTGPREKQESVEGKKHDLDFTVQMYLLEHETHSLRGSRYHFKNTFISKSIQNKIIRYYFKNRLLINLHSPIILNTLNFSSKEF